ncbi:MAG: hypothetical protein A2808_00580 [Candidatus Moranbacteria bacterium RIFCSPHIGHO2_01_FULL_55_24]|nr:MAG: hypothetical protein A2808_00580 [Candidatus Moranbacteria bacterium RIFCSPHIGHO2_01_FULL_55_24]
MGGVNHQPCNKYLPDSTRLSRALSLARISLESANVVIEDVLLNELEQSGQGNPQEIIYHLDHCERHLDEMNDHLRSISDRYATERGWEPPSVNQINWGSVGYSLTRSQAVNPAKWDQMTKLRLTGSFRDVLRHYFEQVECLKEYSSGARASIQSLSRTIESGSFNRAVEENQAGSFKIDFARLYHGFAEFQEEFLASALLSTESWYQWIKAGSLVDEPTSAAQVA